MFGLRNPLSGVRCRQALRHRLSGIFDVVMLIFPFLLLFSEYIESIIIPNAT